MPLERLRRILSQKKPETITVVSGLPRSGTSMMMRMLEAGGLPLLTDGIRCADSSNPRGYYEFERVKKLPDGDSDWLLQAQGRVVKVISALLEYLPAGYAYQVVFMRRSLEEVLVSQRRMLERSRQGKDGVSDAQLSEIYEKHLLQVEAGLSRRKDTKTLFLSYNELLDDPLPGTLWLNEFLGGKLQLEAMRAVIERDLYRERELGMKEGHG